MERTCKRCQKEGVFFEEGMWLCFRCNSNLREKLYETKSDAIDEFLTEDVCGECSSLGGLHSWTCEKVKK
jgi:hypothetical protein